MGFKKGRYKNILSRLVSVLLLVLIGVAVIPTQDVYAKQQKKTAVKKQTAKKQTSKQAKKTSAKSTSRGSGDVKKEKQKTEKEIAETKKRISDNEKKIKSQLDKLSDLDSQIERQESTIGELTATIDELTLRSDELKDSIAILQKNDSLLCIRVAEGLRQAMVQRQKITPLAFVTGARTVAEARQRLDYLSVLQNAKNKRVNELRSQRSFLEGKRAELDSVQAYHTAAVKQLATAKNILDSRRNESQMVVNSLRNEGASLNKVLQEKKKKIQQLDAELNRIIAEEQKRAEEEARRKREQQKAASNNTKPSAKSQGKSNSKTASSVQQGVADADRNLTGTFAANKGKLLFPVAGKYSIVGTFGRSQHGELDHVQMDNSGIDISVPSGTKARSVFDGTVSSVFFMEGYENIIIVRHGEYLTVFAGLSSINVRKGDKIKTGQNLGTVANIDGSSVLHFEVRKERSKLNPLQWVK